MVHEGFLIESQSMQSRKSSLPIARDAAGAKHTGALSHQQEWKEEEEVGRTVQTVGFATSRQSGKGGVPNPNQPAQRTKLQLFVRLRQGGSSHAPASAGS